VLSFDNSEKALDLSLVLWFGSERQSVALIAGPLGETVCRGLSEPEISSRKVKISSGFGTCDKSAFRQFVSSARLAGLAASIRNRCLTTREQMRRERCMILHDL